jgi:hypothetical protein
VNCQAEKRRLFTYAVDSRVGRFSKWAIIDVLCSEVYAAWPGSGEMASLPAVNDAADGGKAELRAQGKATLG